jgi:hypothetical protein
MKHVWILLAGLLLWLALLVGGCSPAQRKVCGVCNFVSLPFDLFAPPAVVSTPTTQPVEVPQ